MGIRTDSPGSSRESSPETAWASPFTSSKSPIPPSSVTEEETEYLYDQNFFSLRDACLQSKTLFEDPEFPDDNDLLRDRSRRYEEEIEWMRPADILRGREEPVLVADTNEGFDIRKGLDTWFVPALSAIAENEKLLRKVVPSDQGFSEKDKYAGIFRFRFWFGSWIEVVVDDRLPVRRDEPLYLKSNSTLEFWPSLLEKAYAKAKGSYEQLNHWAPIDGCIELTGGIPERVRNLNQLLTEDAQDADRLFFDVLRALRVGNIVLASPPPKTREDKLRLAEASELGLQVKHIYRVTQVANLGQERQLIRVKDCSKSSVSIWIGAWHPKDARWSSIPEEIRRELDSETFHDGGFWMAYGDFLKYFKTLDICHIGNGIDSSASFRGRWEIDHNAGGVLKGDFRNYAHNPQCFIQLDDPDYRDPLSRCSAIISLMQKRKDHCRAKGKTKIGFKVYRVDEDVEELSRDFFSLRRNDKSHKKVAKTPSWHDGRESNIRVRLMPGKYCIIPSTYEPEVEGDFMLRVHFEKHSREGDAEYLHHQSIQHGEEEEDELETEVDVHTRLMN
eukprot:TRINITY_DN1060_c0_g2_i11.p1 TRINITY_DN1060_c0_g2~~TRINITY_DN1060_c0_g2_i11.p1  ORF type:complete len:559 (+),score=121.63 TRINITY_DN1060_c0_g2_i11:116-1792(+)